MKTVVRCTGSAIALSLSFALASTAVAGGDAIKLKIADPGTRSYDSTALGRATHTVRLSVANATPQSIALEPLVMHFRPVRDGIAYDCDEPRARDGRWPNALDPGSSFSFAREVTCETPLPGRYQVEVRGRSKSAPASSERALGSFAMQIDPGPNPPVQLPWDSATYAAVSGTKDLRPVKDPNAARIVVALVNASKAPVTIAPSRVSLRVNRRGYSAPVCGERIVELGFSGALAPGKSQSQTTSLGCDLSSEAQYDVDVALVHANGTRVHLATHPVRVRVNAPDSPGPQDWGAEQFMGGS